MKIFLIIFFILFVFVSIILFAEKKIPGLKNSESGGTVYYMNSEKKTLYIVEGMDGKNDPANNFKIYLDNIDYTRFVKDLIASYPLSFASGQLMIFSKNKVEFKSDKWVCAKGTIFIPKTSEVIIIYGSDIIVDDENELLKVKDSKLKKFDLDNNLKEENSDKEFSLDLRNCE